MKAKNNFLIEQLYITKRAQLKGIGRHHRLPEIWGRFQSWCHFIWGWSFLVGQHVSLCRGLRNWTFYFSGVEKDINPKSANPKRLKMPFNWKKRRLGSNLAKIGWKCPFTRLDVPSRGSPFSLISHFLIWITGTRPDNFLLGVKHGTSQFIL